MGPARNALKLARGKVNNLVHDSMVTLTQHSLHGRRVNSAMDRKNINSGFKKLYLS